MSLSEFGESVNNVSSLPDKPAISSEDLKKVFDKAGVDIKKYLNETLLKELKDELAKKVNIGSGVMMTQAERTKLTGIQEGANKTVILSGTSEPTAEMNADLYIQTIN